MGFFLSLFSAYQASDFLGKLLFLSLLFLSSFSWTYFLQRLFFFIKIKKANQHISFVLKEKTSPLSSPVPENPNTPFYEIYTCLQKQARLLLQKNHSHFDIKKQTFLTSADLSLLEDLLFLTLEKQGHLLEKNLFFLPTTITLAPFLGLLGTVWGILLTFSEISSSSYGMNSSILPHLSMALSTTVAGLIVAIPSLIFYNYLKNEIEKTKKEMHLFAQNLMIQTELQYRKKEAYEEKNSLSEELVP